MVSCHHLCCRRVFPSHVSRQPRDPCLPPGPLPGHGPLWPARPGPGLLGADGLLLDVCAGVSGEGPGLWGGLHLGPSLAPLPLHRFRNPLRGDADDQSLPLLHHELRLLQEKEATSYLEPDFDPYARSWLWSQNESQVSEFRLLKCFWKWIDQSWYSLLCSRYSLFGGIKTVLVPYLPADTIRSVSSTSKYGDRAGGRVSLRPHSRTSRVKLERFSSEPGSIPLKQRWWWGRKMRSWWSTAAFCIWWVYLNCQLVLLGLSVIQGSVTCCRGSCSEPASKWEH